MDVLVHFVGSASAGEDTDRVELTALGDLELTDAGYILQYEDEGDEDGETVTTVLTVTPPLVTMQRLQDAAASLVLEHGKRHQCLYSTPYGALEMGIYTKKIESRMTAHGGDLRLCYAMDIGGNLSDHEVCIDVRPVM